MLSFSYFIILFSLVYLLLNIFMFLIPPFQILLETFIFTRWIIICLYILFPLSTLAFTLLFIESYILSLTSRNKFKQSDERIQKKMKAKWLQRILKYLGLFVAFFVILILLLGVIFIWNRKSKLKGVGKLKKSTKNAFGITLIYTAFLTIYSNILTQLYPVIIALWPLMVLRIGPIDITIIIFELIVAVSGLAAIFLLVYYFVR